MADGGSVTVRVLPDTSEFAATLREQVGGLSLPITLDDDSIDRLATAIATKLDGKVAAAIDGAANTIGQG